LQILDGSIKSGSHTIYFDVSQEGSDEKVSEKSIFFMSR